MSHEEPAQPLDLSLAERLRSLDPKVVHVALAELFPQGAILLTINGDAVSMVPAALAGGGQQALGALLVMTQRLGERLGCGVSFMQQPGQARGKPGLMIANELPKGWPPK